MPKKIAIIVQESNAELKRQLSRQKSDRLRHRIKMLQLIKSGDYPYKTLLADKLRYERHAIDAWIRLYKKGGIDTLLEINSGGNGKCKISNQTHDAIEKQLRDPSTNITSYVELLNWVRFNHQAEIEYKALWKYCRHHFKSKLKVSRKSHIKKDPEAEEVFKKTASIIA